MCCADTIILNMYHNGGYLAVDRAASDKPLQSMLQDWQAAFPLPPELKLSNNYQTKAVIVIATAQGTRMHIVDSYCNAMHESGSWCSLTTIEKGLNESV